MFSQLPSEVTRRNFGLFTEEELAFAIGIKPGTLETWRGRGEGPPYVKLGKQVFYYEPDIIDWIKLSRHLPKKAGTADYQRSEQ